jgi:WD40 repeat protein/serine/threonine protein kinase
MPLSACPNREQLSGYVLGALNEPTCEAIAEHVETCATCEATVQSLEHRPDTIVEQLRLPAPEDRYAKEPACAHAIARIEALDSVLAAGGDTNAGSPRPTLALGGTLRVYRLLEKLGEGGMGTVYRALHTDLDKVVALKVLSGKRIDDERAVARFRREMKAVGKLEHPHIVRALDAGVEAGTHYLVMEHVAGLDVGKVVERLGPLPPADACEVVRQAALGLQHAHEHGLIHRDVKPSNLILSGPVVKVLDLGLARLAERSAETSSELTREGQLMGTLEYMAPEQGLDTHSVDARADVYSLGATLYKLLCGQAPFSGGRYAAPLQKAMGLALDEAPPVRERRAAKLAERGATSSAEVPEALAALVHRMLAKDPAQRPATAAKVATALEPFCRGSDLAALLQRASAAPSTRAAEQTISTDDHRSLGSSLREPAPVEAPPEREVEPPAPRTPAPQAAPRRKRVAVLVAAGLLFLVGSIVLAQIIIRIRDNQGKIVAEVTIPEGKTGEIVRDGKVIATIPGEKEPSGAKPPATGATIQPAPLPPVKGGEPLSPLALVQHPAEIKGVRSWTLETISHRGAVFGATYSPDGRWLATGGEDGAIRLWEPGTGRLIHALVGHDGGGAAAKNASGVDALCWAPDSKTLASAEPDGTVRLWNAEAGRLLRTWQAHQTEVVAIAWSPDGTTLASSGQDCTVRLWETASGQPRWSLQGNNPSYRLAWSPDGKMLALAGLDPGELWFTDPESGKVRSKVKGAPEAIRALAWSPDGKRLVTGGHFGGLLQIWNAQASQLLETHEMKGRALLSAVWSPDSKRVAFGIENDCVYLWTPGSGKPVRFLERLIANPLALTWSPDGKTLVTGEVDGTIQLWDAASGELTQTLRSHPQPLFGYYAVVAWSPDGKTIAALFGEKIALWDTASGLLRGTPGDGRGLGSLAFSPDGAVLACAYQDHIVLQEPASGMVLRELRGGGALIAWSSDSKILASLGAKETLCLWEAATGKLLHTLEGHPIASAVLGLAWSPDNKVLASGANDGTIGLWDAATGKLLHRLKARDLGATCAFAWSPDGKSLASGGYDQSPVHVWDAGTGDLLNTLLGHKGNVICLFWSPDGKTLVSGGDRDGQRYWDAATGRLLRTLKVPPLGVPSPDCRYQVGGTAHLRLSDATTGQALGSLVPLLNDRYLAVTASGHYRGSPGLERDLVYVVQTDKGQETLTPEQFAQRYGWKNDPTRVHLIEK